MNHEHQELLTILEQIDPEDACRELQATDEQLAARLSEGMGRPIDAGSDLVRLTRLVFKIAARR